MLPTGITACGGFALEDDPLLGPQALSVREVAVDQAIMV
jgi:hypothetical protein